MANFFFFTKLVWFYSYTRLRPNRAYSLGRCPPRRKPSRKMSPTQGFRRRRHGQIVRDNARSAAYVAFPRNSTRPEHRRSARRKNETRRSARTGARRDFAFGLCPADVARERGRNDTCAHGGVRRACWALRASRSGATLRACACH